MRTIIAACLFCIVVYPLGAMASGTPSQLDGELSRLLKQAANEASSFRDRYDASVWLTDMSDRLRKHIPDDNYRIQLLKNIHHEAKRSGIQPEIVMAVIEVESNFNQFAISRAGAQGLMQVMPFWLKNIGRPGDNLFKMKTNLRYGCTILKYYIEKEKGNLTRALERYNGSYGKWKYPSKVYRALDKHWYAN